MVAYSEVQRTSPSVAFLFARLGALIESSAKPLGVLSPVGTYPPIEGFAFSSGGLGLVLGDLYPLLYKSQVCPYVIFANPSVYLFQDVFGLFPLYASQVGLGVSSFVKLVI